MLVSQGCVFILAKHAPSGTVNIAAENTCFIQNVFAFCACETAKHVDENLVVRSERGSAEVAVQISQKISEPTLHRF